MKYMHQNRGCSKKENRSFIIFSKVLFTCCFFAFNHIPWRNRFEYESVCKFLACVDICSDFPISVSILKERKWGTKCCQCLHRQMLQDIPPHLNFNIEVALRYNIRMHHVRGMSSVTAYLESKCKVLSICSLYLNKRSDYVSMHSLMQQNFLIWHTQLGEWVVSSPRTSVPPGANDICLASPQVLLRRRNCWQHHIAASRA